MLKGKYKKHTVQKELSKKITKIRKDIKNMELSKVVNKQISRLEKRLQTPNDGVIVCLPYGYHRHFMKGELEKFFDERFRRHEEWFELKSKSSYIHVYNEDEGGYDVLFDEVTFGNNVILDIMNSLYNTDFDGYDVDTFSIIAPEDWKKTVKYLASLCRYDESHGDQILKANIDEGTKIPIIMETFIWEKPT